MARLKPGVGIEQARAEMTAIADRIAQAYPNSNKGIGATVFPLREEVTRNSSQTLLTLLAAFGFVLLIACANVANLLLARGVERSKEIAVRAAIGAGRWRLIRQLITETTLLALSGGVCAILLAKWMLAGVMPLIPRDVSRTDGIAINLRAMFFTLTAALLCSLLCGLAPATQTAKVNLTETLKDAGYGTAGGRRSRAWRSSLIVLQLALTTVLLVGAGLLTNSLVRLYRTDPGLDGQNLLTMSLSLKRGKGDGPPLWNEFWNSLVEKARGLPGVQDAALVYSLPLSDSPSGMSVGIPGGVAKKPNEAAGCYFNTVSHNYFRLLGIGLRRGRNFSDVDKADSPPAVVINESFARSYFTGQEPLGKTITIDRGSKTEKEAVVIGVVADSHARLDEPIQPTIYLSLLQYPQSSMYLVARTATDPAGYFGAMRNLVSALNKDLPAGQSRTMTEIRATYTARPRFYLSLLGSLAILAASLSAVGIYGVLSHGINQRRHEIGVRRALGAQDGDVRGLVIRQGMALAAIGVIVGLGGALALTRLMRGWLYEVSATDPLTFLLVAGALLLVALAACYAPARRATAVDPMAALRNQ
jgi:putative ABC transport system permease protein